MTFSMSGVEDGWSYNRFDIYEKRNKKEDCPKCGDDECECDEPVKEGLDPVGKEDADINNDGKKDSSDKYLLNRRKAIGKAMKKEETEVVSEGDFPKDAPSIKDKKEEKKIDVKYDPHMKVMAPQVKKESYTAQYMEGYKKLPDAKMQDKAAMKPDTARGESQARKMDTVRKATKLFPGEVKDMVKGREMDNKKKGLERRFNAPSADGAETKKMKNKAYKLENQRRQDLNKRYGPKKEEFEAWLSELPDEVTIFTEEELFGIFESRLEE